MSSKPETTFIASVHKHLPPKLYRMKTHNPYIGGPADVWYSGSKGDLWVEYKFIPKITPALCALPALSALQLQWLNERYAEGRNVAVIVGCKEGGVLYQDKDWEKPLDPDQFNRLLKTRDQLARWILAFTQGGP